MQQERCWWEQPCFLPQDEPSRPLRAACFARRAGRQGDAAGSLRGSPHPRHPGVEQDSLREVMYSGALPGPRGRASS